MNELKYKGYVASIHFSEEDELFVGKVEQVEALIMFSADNVADLKSAFASAIDSYLEECAQSGVEPERGYKGSFNVRVGSKAHRSAALTAQRWGVSLNDFVRVALEQAIDRHCNAPVVSMTTEESAFVREPYPAEDNLVSPARNVWH